MLASLRRMEDNLLDEEMDILREMEMEGRGVLGTAGGVLVADSQGGGNGMPLGVDGAGGSEEEDDDGDGDGKEGGEGKKKYKKKGQKRTTRRVIMKPSRTKPKVEPVWPVHHDDASEHHSPGNHGDGNAIEDKDMDKEASTAQDPPDQSESAKPTSGLVPTIGAVVNKSTTETGRWKKTAKKISATAHANYTRLKLRGKNLAGKGGGGRRFGRRR